MATRRKPAAERRDPQALEERRLRAAELFAQHVHQAEVARTLGVSPQTVSRWHARWQADGVAGLASLWPPGRTPRVSDAQLQQAELAPLEGAKAHGFDTDLWTLHASQRSFGASPGCATTPRTCGGCCAIAWTGACSVPLAARWSGTSRRSEGGSPVTGPGSKNARRRKAAICFFDESGVSLTLWGAETRIRPVSRRSVPSSDALPALVDHPPADASVGPPER